MTTHLPARPGPDEVAFDASLAELLRDWAREGRQDCVRRSRLLNRALPVLLGVLLLDAVALAVVEGTLPRGVGGPAGPAAVLWLVQAVVTGVLIGGIPQWWRLRGWERVGADDPEEIDWAEDDVIA